MRVRFSSGLFLEHAITGLGIPCWKFFQKDQDSNPEENRRNSRIAVLSTVADRTCIPTLPNN